MNFAAEQALEFAADGKALYFMSGTRNERGAPEGRLMVVPLTIGPTLRVGVATTLLSGAAAPIAYAPAQDGRLLVARAIPGRGGEARAVLVQNWPLTLKR